MTLEIRRRVAHPATRERDQAEGKQCRAISKPDAYRTPPTKLGC
jgi:hypothetical protein